MARAKTKLICVDSGFSGDSYADVVVAVDPPCMLVRKSDPLHSVALITVTIDGEAYAVALPEDAFAGPQVEVLFN